MCVYFIHEDISVSKKMTLLLSGEEYFFFGISDFEPFIFVGTVAYSYTLQAQWAHSEAYVHDYDITTVNKKKYTLLKAVILMVYNFD